MVYAVDYANTDDAVCIVNGVDPVYDYFNGTLNYITFMDWRYMVP
jgi:hypothetical protein